MTEPESLPDSVDTSDQAEVLVHSLDAEGSAISATPSSPNFRWYVVKVTAGREDTIRESIERRVRIEGLDSFFGQIYVPVEQYTERRNNKNVTKRRKLYPGYVMAEVEFNDQMLYLFRETSGVGDFVGGGVNRVPQPMEVEEVRRMLRAKGEPVVTTVSSKPKFDVGDQVKVKDGPFSGMDGEVKEILEAVNRVKVEVTIIGRALPVELEYWQVELI